MIDITTENNKNDHEVFRQLRTYANFYENLSFSVFQFIPLGLVGTLSIDSYVFSSIKGTLESILCILGNGRINDAYALLRKYYDVAIINIYTNLYLDDNFDFGNIVVEKIQNWLYGKEQFPDIRTMNNYIQKSKRISKIYKLLNKDKRYTELRDRCNNHTHYNFYYNILLNIPEMTNKNNEFSLDTFSNDLLNVFILHLSYLFYIKDYYMIASDFLDCKEVGIPPAPDMEYLVAPFVQEIFTTVIEKHRPDIGLEIKRMTSMLLE